MDIAKKRLVERRTRAEHVRKRVFGAAERPRMCVRRSLIHIYAQIIDDTTGKSLVLVGSNSKDVASRIGGDKKATKTDIAKIVGELTAEKAQEKGIAKVVFDRKGYLFNGRIKALADAARGKGLVF